ncbi:alcohol dehydrogenase catalytic domain-containing protein [Streptacidiphilus sp. 4-A2]|nr:alcohol dehydrogenase catalytic domain-containing protein [Streptacidiphilus sp. 4-A2]
MWASSIACGTCPSCRLREPTLCEARRTYGVNRPITEASPLRGSWADLSASNPVRRSSGCPRASIPWQRCPSPARAPP